MATTHQPTLAGSQLSLPKTLRDKIIFTLLVLGIYRLGVAIPTPGIDSQSVLQFFQAQSGSIFGLFNTFTGGALERFSVFALGIMPYISASIIFQLLQATIPQFEALKKEGEQGRKKITQYTRYATVLLSVIQGYGMGSLLSQSNFQGQPLISSPWLGPFPFIFMTIVTLTAGSCFIMWLGEQITERGIGNGASLIIFANIVAGLPSGTLNLIQMVKNGQMRFVFALGVVLFMLLVIALIVFMEVGQRRIPIQYSQRGSGRMAMQQQMSHLPLKLNFSGVIPPIFASSLLLFPATMAQFFNVPWIQSIKDSLTPTGNIYNVIFVILIVFFCFFYTEIVFNPNEVADNLKKYGGFVPGIRSGRNTAQYIKKVLDRLTVGGAIYLSAICILPTLLAQKLNLPFYLGGTSLLIIVGVALDTSQQIQSHLLTAKYEGVMKGVKIKSRRIQY